MISLYENMLPFQRSLSPLSSFWWKTVDLTCESTSGAAVGSTGNWSAVCVGIAERAETDFERKGAAAILNGMMMMMKRQTKVK